MLSPILQVKRGRHQAGSLPSRRARRYRIDEILDDGEREFGGYDFVLLWQSYPRLRVDDRNQFDLYRDMPDPRLTRCDQSRTR